MRVLGVITARGGSKGVPRKNLRPLCGKPLLAWTAETALAAPCLERVVLSTDDEEIAALGRALGLEVPFLRPAELATDEAPMLPVVQHAVRFLESEGSSFDAICLLQPTSPSRTPAAIQGCVDLMIRRGVDSVFTTVPIPVHHHPLWAYVETPEGLLRLACGSTEPVRRRQDLPAAFRRDGSIYLVRTRVLMADSSLYGASTAGFPIDDRYAVTIDSPEDWNHAELVFDLWLQSRRASQTEVQSARP
jgi:CMP-N,N'-diacetyllegionaminic acid synthase